MTPLLAGEPLRDSLRRTVDFLINSAVTDPWILTFLDRSEGTGLGRQRVHGDFKRAAAMAEGWTEQQVSDYLRTHGVKDDVITKLADEEVLTY